jgi:beta-phosphoglucomutase-like phosphatase (HAD superfamily)
MGISSGACRQFIDEFLKYFHLDMIEASTSANEVTNKKPAPDVFIATFKKLEQKYEKPSIKWVIGDGKTDVIGGNASNAKTILCYHEYDVPYYARIDNFSEIIDIITRS